MGELLNEQRHAFGAGDNAVHHAVGQQARGKLVAHHGGGFMWLEPGQLQRAHRLSLQPGAGATGHQQRQRLAWQLMGHMVQGVQRRRIGPVQIFHHQQHRRVLGQMPQPMAQRLNQQLLLQHRRHRAGILAGKRQGQPGAKNRHHPIHIAAGVMQYLGEAGNLRHRLDAGQHMLAQQGQ